MEFLNKIELKGLVGVVSTRPLSEGTITNFSVCTEFVFKGANASCIECTWFRVTAFDIPELLQGDHVHVIGRLRQQRYCNSDGHEVVSYEVLASKVELIYD